MKKAATDSHEHACYLVCSDDALKYVPAEVTDRGLPIGEGVVVGPNALRDAIKKVRDRKRWDKRPVRIYALVEVDL